MLVAHFPREADEQRVLPQSAWWRCRVLASQRVAFMAAAPTAGPMGVEGEQSLMWLQSLLFAKPVLWVRAVHRTSLIADGLATALMGFDAEEAIAWLELKAEKLMVVQAADT